MQMPGAMNRNRSEENLNSFGPAGGYVRIENSRREPRNRTYENIVLAYIRRAGFSLIVRYVTVSAISRRRRLVRGRHRGGEERKEREREKEKDRIVIFPRNFHISRGDKRALSVRNSSRRQISSELFLSRPMKARPRASHKRVDSSISSTTARAPYGNLARNHEAPRE